MPARNPLLAVQFGHHAALLAGQTFRQKRPANKSTAFQDMKTVPAPTEESKVFGKYLSKLDLFDKPFFIIAKVLESKQDRGEWHGFCHFSIHCIAANTFWSFRISLKLSPSLI
jgi:hypothetical protein